MVYSPFSIVAETIYLKRVFMFLTTNRKFGGWRVFIVPHVIKEDGDIFRVNVRTCDTLLERIRVSINTQMLREEE